MEIVAFGPFRLDPARRLLLRDGASTRLRPKTLAVLLLLLRRAGEIVSKEELLASVWGGNAVSEYVLTTCISELRAAFGETSKQPSFLTTVHGSGYQLNIARDGRADRRLRGGGGTGAEALIVGRDREFAQMAAAHRRACAGQRQVVFITGEMGIGKTTLADTFFAGLEHQSTETLPGRQSTTPILLGRGQCIEQYGAGEPYMPIFEAIGRLAREVDDSLVLDVLRRYAPTWLIQIPGLLPPDERAELRRELPAETQEHMLRLIADGIEARCDRRPLVLWLEDLHLSDRATLELVATLALRRGPAQLLIVGTFRSAEDFPAAASFQSLKHQLLLHRQCEEIALAPLTREAVDLYLANRFPALTLPRELGTSLHERTEGNPLFIARMVDQLLEDGVLQVDHVASALHLAAGETSMHVPRNLRALIEQRSEALGDEDRAILEAASVAGVHFVSTSVAAALGDDAEAIERQCRQLARRHGFLAVGTEAEGGLPDLGARYRFSHALYQQVLYEGLDDSRRRRLHHAIGSALRETWAARADEIAAELASHFERGGDLPNAIEFYGKAGAAAAGQGASREAVGYLDRALALSQRGEDSPAHRELLLGLLMARGPSVLAASGYPSSAVLDNYQRALELARQLGDPIRQMGSLVALATCHHTRCNLNEAEQLALELVRVAEQAYLPAPFVAQLHNPLSQVRLYQGAVEEALALADAATAAMRVLPMPQTPPDSRPALWAEPSVMLHCQRGAASFALGRLAQAGAESAEALRIARELRHPFNLTYALAWAALYENGMGNWEAALRLATEARETASAYDFPFWEGLAMIFAGHATAADGDPATGLTTLRAGIDLWSGTGARLAAGNNFNLLADVYLLLDDIAGAQAALADAETHAERTGERVFLAETYRLRAECQRRLGAAPDAVETTLRRAITTTHQQGTKLWELRATLALHRLRRSRGSRSALATVCSAFEHEPAARDILAARSTLAE